MFAGIIKGTGRIVALDSRGGDKVVGVDLDGVDLGPLAAGASVAISGVCLTALEPVATLFRADVSRETLAVTTLGRAEVGTRVNLEPSLKLGDPIDGHLVYGHVDGVARVAAIEPEARSWRITIEPPDVLARYIAAKGSVAIDGVSLTVNRVGSGSFDVNVIPHTRALTTIAGYGPGTTVNIEVDMMARYVERLVRHDEPGITIDTLRRHGFTGDN